MTDDFSVLWNPYLCKRVKHDDVINGLAMWSEWQSREYLRKYYTQKCRENDQEENPAPDG